MPEKPILFSGPMVRAILAGTKTQTRRIVKPQPKGRLSPWDMASEPGDVYIDGSVPVRCVESRGRNKRDAGELSLRPVPCPYGVPGDRLWVREAWRQNDAPSDCVHYMADEDECSGGPWRPSIHMPRWASRITLEVTEVRVQRLQEISEEDAKAEGVNAVCPGCGQTLAQDDETEAHWICEDGNDGVPFEHRVGFERLWGLINGKRAPWSSNPWVWAITFRRIKP